MKVFLRGFYYSLPIQLVLLHFRKFQVLLLFWLLLFLTIGGNFMQSFGADSLFLAPEYLGKVNALSAAIVGVAVGIFIMSWNITTFILFCRHFRFLATTTNPFLKYCMNNAVIPILFLIFYFIQTVRFDSSKELMSGKAIFILILGFLCGLGLILFISLVYFFGADKTIVRRLKPVIISPRLFKDQFMQTEARMYETRFMRVEWYFGNRLELKKVRDVGHYSKEFLENVFNRHHFAAVLSIFIAFVFLIIIGFFLDKPFFQLPAAAGVAVFLAILIAVTGAFSYFLQTWSIPLVIIGFLFFNFLYKKGYIDPTNKAYGVNYLNVDERPSYTSEYLAALCTKEKMAADKRKMIQILETWKKKQKQEKPVMYIINTSGGGNRSATFTMNVMQRLDSLSGGNLMNSTFLITGASGGMLGASYYRSLVREKMNGKPIDPLNKKYVANIAKDLLNPLFTSFVARDLVAPAQKFKVGEFEYIKDRGYAFEQKLNANTEGLLNHQLKHWEADEREARVPLIFYSSVITRDGRKLLVSTQPISFMMRAPVITDNLGLNHPDAVDFKAMFSKQNPMDLRVLTALRMNATFPYVLPNVWLPSQPVIDVMDAGLRDNYGLETTTRFLEVFSDWLLENTSKVVILEMRDRRSGAWEHPYESGNISELATKPFLIIQNNWYKMQEFNQNNLLSLLQPVYGSQLSRIPFQYAPGKEERSAALNFHLTRREQLTLAYSLDDINNKKSFDLFSASVNGNLSE